MIHIHNQRHTASLLDGSLSRKRQRGKGLLQQQTIGGFIAISVPFVPTLIAQRPTNNRFGAYRIYTPNQQPE